MSDVVVGGVIILLLQSFLMYIYVIQCDFMPKVCSNNQILKIADFIMKYGIPNSAITENSPKAVGEIKRYWNGLIPF